MKLEGPPQPNPVENSELQEIKFPDQTSEVTPVSPTLEENTSEADIAASQEADAKKLTKLREQLGLQPETDGESLEQRKERLDNIWANWQKIQNDPELLSLFGRKKELISKREVDEVLREHDYPERTKISELQFETWQVNLNPKFIKDGFVYLLRGDNPNLDKKGFYTRTYGYGKTQHQTTYRTTSWFRRSRIHFIRR